MRHGYTPTLTELQAFAEVAQSGSATRAAQNLGLTQSAVSRSLASLEDRLGVALFHRVRRRLVLSDAGRALWRDAMRILDDLDQSALTVMSFGGHSEVLRMACLPSFAAAWLVPRLADFAGVAPDVTFDMSTTLGPVDFDQSPLDFAVYRGPVPPQGVAFDVLAEERLVVVASPALVPPGGLDDARLASLPLLQQATRPNLWRDWFQGGGQDKAAFARGPRFEQFAMVLAAAQAGLGVALVPEVLAADDLARGRLVKGAARSLLTATPYLLTYPERSMAVPAFVALRDWLVTRGTG